MSFYLWSLLLPSLATATPPMEDAFLTYALSRKYEAQVQELQKQEDLSPVERLVQERQLGASLTEARIAFNSILKNEKPKMDAWEVSLLEKIDAGKPTGNRSFSAEHLHFLQESFPRAAAFSSLEWKVLGEWFGAPTQTAFLESSFRDQAFADANTTKKHILLVIDPLTTATAKKAAEALPAAAAAWKAEGHEVEVLRLSPFAHLDDIAEELHQALSHRKGPPVLVVTEGNASGILLRALDLNPRLRRSPSVAGWVNVNGQLYGQKNEVSKARRGLASLPSLQHQEEELRNGIASLQAEGLERPTPLGDGFPIWNLLATGHANREARVTEGETLTVAKGPALPHAVEVDAAKFTPPAAEDDLP